MPTRIKVTRTIAHIIDVDTDDPEEAARRAADCLCGSMPGAMLPGCSGAEWPPHDEVSASVVTADEVKR